MPQVRWPSIVSDSRRHLTTEWRRYYVARHIQVHIAETDPIAIEDCHRPGCPILLSNMDRKTGRGRVFNSRSCANCGVTVLRCKDYAEADVIQHNELVAKTSLLSFRAESPSAYLALKEPPATLDWGFEPWYFGAISRDNAYILLIDGPEG